MDSQTHEEQRKRESIPWIRASNLQLKPLDNRAPITPLYYRLVATVFVYFVMTFALAYILAVVSYHIYKL